MMTTEDSMQYDESYGAYEEGYDEGAYYQEGGQEAAGGAGMESFALCSTWLLTWQLLQDIGHVQ